MNWLLTYPEDGPADESFAGPAPAVGVQWHPERLPLDHPASRDLRALWAGLARA